MKSEGPAETPSAHHNAARFPEAACSCGRATRDTQRKTPSGREGTEGRARLEAFPLTFHALWR